MRATKGTDGVALHLFVIEDARIGVDLELTETAPDGSQRVLAPERMGELFRGRGDLFDAKAGGRERYRARVNSTLFGLDDARYDQLIEVLLHLRRPKLSQSLSLETVQDWLTDSLPPLDTAIVGQQGDALEGLRRAQEELDSLVKAERLLGEFVGVYRGYATRALARRAADLRRANSEYEQAGRNVTAAERAEAAVDRRVAGVERRRGRFERLTAATAARLAAFDLRDADALDRLAETMRRTAGEAANAEERRQTAGGRRDRSVATAADARDGAAEAAIALASELRQAGARADTLAISRSHASAVRSIEAPADVVDRAEYTVAERAHATLEQGAERRARQVEDLWALAGRVRAAEDEAGRAEVRRVDKAAAEEAALEALTAAETLSAERLSAFAERLYAFAVSARCVVLGEAEVDRIVAGVEAGNGSANLLEVAAGPARQSIADRRAVIRARRLALANERTQAEDRLAAIRADAPLEPEPFRTRTHTRTAADGVPFYALVDFADAVPFADRAGLEAAIEGAGLLDALVCHDGSVLDPDAHDVILDPDAPRAGARRTLSDVLVPVDGLPVPPARIRSVLESIALGPDGTVGVEIDGRFRTGPLSGRYGKAEAEWIGQGAREITRRRRIAELEAAIEVIDASLAALQGERDTVDQAERDLAEELSRAPSDGELVQARSDEQATRQRADQATGDRKRADEAAQRLSREAERVRARLTSDLDATALTGRAADLEALRHEAQLYRGHVTTLRSLASGLARATRSLASARREESEAVAAAIRLAEEAGAARTVAEAAKSAHDALERTVGSDVRAVLAARSRELARAERSGRHETRLAKDDREAIRAQEKARGETTGARDRQGEHERRRNEVAQGFQAMPADFFELAFQEPLDEAPTTWSLTAAIAAVRRIERDYRFDADEIGQAAIDRTANEVTSRLARISTEVPEYRIEIQTEGGLSVAYAIREGRQSPVPGLRDLLVLQIEEARELLAERERRLFEEFLLAELGRHLGERIRGARAIVRRMNDALDGVSTNSGDRVSVRWAPRSDTGDETTRAVALLEKDPALLAPEQLATLVSFFRAKVDEARTNDAQGTWADQLARVIDYRNWFAFTLEERRGGRTVPITARSHATGSGGEKSVKLHLPLFAILAAYYQTATATAPRLLLLDEAFAGIDEGMRGQMFGLLARFGFSFVMTSEREWGMYPELDGTAIYVLNRRKDLRGVLAEHFTWNGDTLSRLDDA